MNVNQDVNQCKPTRLTFTILKLLGKGKYAKQIAEELKVSRQLVSRYIKNLKKMGFIRETNRTSCAIIELTERGKTAIKLSDVNQPSSGMRTPTSTVNVHHMEIALPILKDAEVDWKEWELRNWKPKFKKIPILGASLMKTPGMIIVKIWSRKLDDIREIYRLAAIYSAQAAGYLKDSYSIEVAWWDYAVSGQEIHFRKPTAEKFVKEGLCIRTDLGRDRVDIGPNDPREEAQVWDDSTPVPGRETNCPEYVYKEQMMPEYVHGLFTMLTGTDGLMGAVNDIKNEWRLHRKWLKGNIKVNEEILKLLHSRQRGRQRNLGEFV